MTLPTIDITKTLDDIESNLPALPAKSVALGRAAVRRGNDVVLSIVSDVARRADRVVSTARTGAATTTGQARAAAERTGTTASSTFGQTVGQARSGAARTSAAAKRTVAETVGQTRSAAERTSSAATTGVKETAGQARAQAGATGAAAGKAAEGLLDDATAAVDPRATAASPDYASWSKAELYERAQTLDIDGRSSMNKQQLVRALRSA